MTCLEDDKVRRLGGFSLCFSAAEFPPDDDNSRRCFCDYVRRFTFPPAFVGSASDTLAYGMYRITTDWEWGSQEASPQWCARSSSVTQSATCQFGPHPTRALRRLHRRDNRHRQNWSGVLLRSCLGDDKAVYQKMHAGGRREGQRVRVVEQG